MNIENFCYERREGWKNKDSARATETCCSRMKYKIAEINKKLQNRVDRWRDLQYYNEADLRKWFANRNNEKNF